MRFIIQKSWIILLFLAFISCDKVQNRTQQLSTAVTPSDIETHIAFLASNKLRGRLTGSAGAEKAAHYIADYFKKFGLMTAGTDQSYFQTYTANLASVENPHDTTTIYFDHPKRTARNVVGLVKGTEQPHKYIIIGAHFDHLGVGKFGSLSPADSLSIHNGADDNASGTSGLLELAQYYSQHPAQKSILFIAFSGEEEGLWGSQYFVEHPTVPIDSVIAMINMDMIGRLRDQKLIIMGTGTTKRWNSIIQKANDDSLHLKTAEAGYGPSDHTSFYFKDIPVLFYFTGAHEDYHRPTDDVKYINAKGEDRVLEHLKRVIAELDTLSMKQMAFTKAPRKHSRDVSLEGPTLGVMPDYGYTGTGLRITGVQTNEPAANAGLQGGDIIIRLADKKVDDIYVYMEILNTLEKGQKTTVTVKRNGTKKTFDITL